MVELLFSRFPYTHFVGGYTVQISSKGTSEIRLPLVLALSKLANGTVTQERIKFHAGKTY